MAKKKTLRTLPDLQQALAGLVHGDARAEATKHIVHRQDKNTKSESTFFGGELRWHDPPDGGPLILVHEVGDTLLDAYIACKNKLAQEIEERARKRQLNHDRSVDQRVIEHKPRRLEHTLVE